MQKSKDDILAALSENIPVAPADKSLSITKELPDPPSEAQLNADTEEDYEFGRGQVKALIDISKDAILTMSNLANDAEHPRAFEVLGTLMKQSADMSAQLLDMQKQRKALLQDKNGYNVGTTNNLIMTTTDLQKMLKSEKEVVDVEVTP